MERILKLRTADHRSVLKLVLFLFLIFSTACEKESDDFVQVSAEDEAMWRQIAAMGNAAAELWPSFNHVQSKHAYIILTDDNGDNQRGYLLNPTSPLPPASVRVDPAKVGGLTVYRNDHFLEAAQKILGGNGTWRFFGVEINGEPWFTAREKRKLGYTFYDDFKNGNDEHWLPLVMSHEMFHLMQINSWTYPEFEPKDWADYPVTKEILTCELALLDLMNQAHSVWDPVTAKTLLAKFVTLFNEMCNLDPTPDNIVFQLGGMKMHFEGSARYTEHFSALKTIYPSINTDPSHGYSSRIPEITSAKEVALVFGERLWYSIGAGVINLLVKSHVNVSSEMASGQTPVDLAIALLNLTTNQEQAILADIKTQPSWSLYEQQAEYLMGLF